MAVSEIPYHRFSVKDYHRMGELKILKPDERVELIDGRIFEMAPIGSRHAATVDRLTELLRDAVAKTAIVRVQNPVETNEYSEPQPDVSLLRRRADFYESAHPATADVLLTIEVSDSRVGYDRAVKVPHYAANGIVETWLIDLPAEAIEVHTQPTPAGYGEMQVYRRGAAITPSLLPEVTVNVSDILGGTD